MISSTLTQATEAPKLLETTDPVFVRRLARNIREECAMDGFYSSFGCETGSRRFFGFVHVIKGRLMAREINGDESDGWIDLTGIESVWLASGSELTAYRYSHKSTLKEYLSRGR